MFGFLKILVSLHPQTRNKLDYGVMVTLQILVLTFLVRVQVVQQRSPELSKESSGLLRFRGF